MPEPTETFLKLLTKTEHEEFEHDNAGYHFLVGVRRKRDGEPIAAKLQETHPGCHFICDTEDPRRSRDWWVGVFVPKKLHRENTQLVSILCREAKFLQGNG